VHCTCPLLGGADPTVCGWLLSRSLFGAKRTWAVALHMPAFDQERKSLTPANVGIRAVAIVLKRGSAGDGSSSFPWWAGHDVAAGGASAATGKDLAHWLSCWRYASD